jgi:hypothetical protein
MITINEPLVKANTQSPEWKYIHIEKRQDGIFANVHFAIKNENGEVVDYKTEEYTGAAFDEWWAGFDTGRHIYEQAFPQVEVPVEVENEFKNVPDVVEETNSEPVVIDEVVE